MGLITEYPSWFILLCLLLGAAYAFFLYFRSDKESVSRWLRLSMAAFRFLVVSLISFLLLSPLIRQNIAIVEKPVIIIGQDNSKSLMLSRDSAFVRGELPGVLDALIANLADRYEVRTYSFGNEVTSPMNEQFDEKSTDIASFFSELSSRYANRNVGAIVLVSDGIYNYGSDPYYAARDLPYPIYTVGLGDTTDHRDMLVKRVLYNSPAFLGDKYPVEIQVDAVRCAGERAILTVKEKDRVVGTQPITIRGNRFSQQFPILLEAKEAGWHRYTISLTPIDGELSKENNSQDIFVEVLDQRTKVLLVYDAPHPDIGAIRNALESNEKFELIERSPEELLLSKDSAALVIFYQVPSVKGIRISESVIAKLPSALFILGSQSDIPAFNKINPGLILSMTRLSFSESYPVLNEAFPYFTVSKPLMQVVSQFPPLQSPFGAFQYSSMTEILAYQRINGTTTRFPLISFNQAPDQKRGFITGENFWRWRITNYTQSGDTKAFDELIQKIVQYLSVKQDRTYFRVKLKSEYQENEAVEIQAEVYNKSYELINDPDVSIVISDENGNSYPFTFGQTGSAYYLRAGTFPPGVYAYRASVSTGQDRYEKRGSFVVTPVDLEAVNLRANHNLLYRIAESHGGEFLLPVNLEALPEILKENEDIHSVSYVQKTFSELINTPWIFLLIIGLLSAEWALRKYSGL
ncbi:vWA domain-containing protein [Bacteroidota bacterium]